MAERFWSREHWPIRCYSKVHEFAMRVACELVFAARALSAPHGFSELLWNVEAG
jgi:hypothetical protein